MGYQIPLLQSRFGLSDVVSPIEILLEIKKNTGIPVISKLSQPAGIDIHMLEQNIFASDLYESVVSDKFGIPFINEYQKQIIHV